MKLISLSLLLFVILITGCITENGNLVDPPSQTQTINIKYLNLASDGELRKLSLDNLIFSNEVGFSQITSNIHPPADSASIIVVKNGVDKYISPYKFRFINKTNYTFISYPIEDTAKIPTNPNLKQDYVSFVSTTPGLLKKKNYAFLQIINAYSDTSKTFDLRMGCQNGSILALNIPYKGLSTQMEVIADNNAITLIDTKTPSEGTMYKEKFNEGNEYTFIIVKDKITNKPKIIFLNNSDTTLASLKEATLVSQSDQNFNLNICNFSSSQIDTFFINGVELFSKLSSQSTSDYKTYSTCKSSNLDKYSIKVNGKISASDSLSFDVLKNYKVFIFDSADIKGKLMVTAKPYFLTESSAGKSVIRVINANYKYSSLNLALGARASQSSTNFTSGELIATGLEYSKTSNPIIINSGDFPLTLFTAYQPSLLVSNSLANLFPDKKYVIVLYRDENELDGFKDKIAIVEEDEKNSNIKTLNQDCFLQIINGLDGAESVDLNIGSQLQKAKLFKSFSLASVIKPGITNLEILNKIENINCQSNDRILAIINGTVDNPSILIKNYKQSAATAKTYLRRFINVSDINDLYIGLNNDSSRIFANPINYGVLSDYETINQERKMSLFFGLAKNIRHIDVKFRLDDISLVFGKTYDIIFAGNSKSGYSAIIYQEY